jgi:hypothetical protein
MAAVQEVMTAVQEVMTAVQAMMATVQAVVAVLKITPEYISHHRPLERIDQPREGNIFTESKFPVYLVL